MQKNYIYIVMCCMWHILNFCYVKFNCLEHLVSLLLQRTCHDMFCNIWVLNVLWLCGVML